MKCNIFTAGDVALLALVAAQFGPTVLAAALAGSGLDKRQTTCLLGTGGDFALLSKAGITNAGGSLAITGDFGVTPAGTVTGITTTAGSNGLIVLNNAAAAAAATAAASGCACANATPPGTLIIANLATTFTPGNYYTNAGASTAASSTITLNGAGKYYFHINGSLTLGASTKVVLTNGAQACDVWWIVGNPTVGAASTLGASTIFKGIICDYGAITAGAGVNSKGSWFTLTGTNIITTAGGTYESCV